MGERRLRNLILSFLDDKDLAKAQYEEGQNMTNRLAAFQTLVKVGKDTDKDSGVNQSFH